MRRERESVCQANARLLRVHLSLIHETVAAQGNAKMSGYANGELDVGDNGRIITAT